MLCKSRFSDISVVCAGPKPLKRFTPPPDYKKGDSSSEPEDSDQEEEEEEEESDEDETGQPGVVRASDKMEDDFLKQVLCIVLSAENIIAIICVTGHRPCPSTPNVPRR